MSKALLTTEERKLLERAINLMEELVETLEVMQDEELMGDLKEALKEIKEGKVKSLSELMDATSLR
ncbi:hypothetical protein DRO24_05165 [Candidatus Bathyarchaeota archaeon]|nr:MAG: hypothetical protein DRO24_05165 [Candidatus Bathyarchaeota archaeon]